jgi:hypothetical protein
MAVGIFASVLTGISILFHRIIRRPLTREQVISTFVVCSLVFIAAWTYNRFHS